MCWQLTPRFPNCRLDYAADMGDMRTVRFLLTLGADARACSADTLGFSRTQSRLKTYTLDFSHARSRLSSPALKLRPIIAELLREHVLAASGDFAERPVPAAAAAEVEVRATAVVAAAVFGKPPRGQVGGALKRYEIRTAAEQLARAAMGKEAVSDGRTVCSECAAVAESV